MNEQYFDGLDDDVSGGQLRQDHELRRCHVPFCVEDAARAAKNVSLWNSYLPTACVRTMVSMGWDYTT